MPQQCAARSCILGKLTSLRNKQKDILILQNSGLLLNYLSQTAQTICEFVCLFLKKLDNDIELQLIY